MDKQNVRLALGIVLGVGAIYLLSQELFDGGRDVGNGRRLQAGGGDVGNGFSGGGSGNGNGSRNNITGGAGEIGNGFVGSGSNVGNGRRMNAMGDLGGIDVGNGIIRNELSTILGIGAAVGAAYLLTSGELSGHAVGNG